ncbi:MAG TPA: rhodanese-like domain-containing protein, partial [Thermoplasmatales archaeon]|nr:rhodanese-like domain-containing protein [Thermoplasmatales archaeon]
MRRHKMGRSLIKHLSFAVIFMLLMTLSGSSNGDEILDDNCTTKDVIDITVEEAWELLSNISNGVQIPVDVRTDEEWRSERINTSYPEYPRHYNLYDLQENETLLQDLLSTYNGMEIILYCKSGGRSAIAGNLLSCSGFNGTIYNMLGGITEWKNKGFPTKVGNTPPNQPDHPIGSTTGKVNTLLNYSCLGNDPDDDVVRYGWDWDGDNKVDEWTDYHPSKTTITVPHLWTSAGIYNIKVMVE